MKISVKNFKSLLRIVRFEIKPLTILSGNNSSGKSSFIQLLLLLKQTIDLDSSNYALYIDGRLYTVRDFLDIIRGKDPHQKLEISFLLTKRDFEQFGDVLEKSIFDSFSDYSCELTIQYAFDTGSPYIDKFDLRYTARENTNYMTITQTKGTHEHVRVEVNNEYFVKGLFDDAPPVCTSVSYSAIFPSVLELLRIETIDNPKEGEAPLQNEIRYSEYPNLRAIKSYFKAFFSRFYYIGPLRDEPKDSYATGNAIDSVGTRGQFVAQILERRKDDPIKALIPTFTAEGIRFAENQITLLEATNYWICEVFKFGKRLYAKEAGENYSIILENHNGVAATIKHVGFGVSQILPIVVQGLLLQSGGILVLEQPEIHLHPKIQSLLFDFLYSITSQNKTVIIETHSDHFITRMRRRIAEEQDTGLRDRINLTFIENGAEGVEFTPMDLNEFGSLSYFPEEFIERPDIELRALLRAQMRKRKQQEGQQ